MENNPFRDKDGKLLFRPGGHGALIENLNDLDADIVFIKNIDNVVPDRLKDDTVTYKKLLAGVLVTLQKQAFSYLELLDGGHYSHAELEEIIRFVQQKLHCRNQEIKTWKMLNSLFISAKAEPSDARLRNGQKRRRTGRRSVLSL